MGGKGSGPRSRPTNLKLLEGVRSDRINRSEPTPAEGSLEPPHELEPDVRAVWDRLAPDLVAKKVLTPWDLDQFEVFCSAVATYHECKRLMGRNYIETGAAGGLIKSPYWQIMRDCESMMRSVGSRFGLTPADRAALKIEPEEQQGSGSERLLS